MIVDPYITVLIPTSPIPSHPNTEILEKVIDSIRFHLPTSEIIIMADGVREQIGHRTVQYAEYLKRVGECCTAMRWGRTSLCLADKHYHQAALTRKVIENYVKTPFIYFSEHDTPLVTTFNPRDVGGNGRTIYEDCIIRWDEICDLLASRGANMVRFYLWEKIWWEHEYLMRGQMIQGESRFIQTVQFSGWPNIATTAYYKRLLAEIPEGKKTMIEPAVIGWIQSRPWTDERLVIYLPEPNGRRFYHLNGRVDANTGKRDPADW